ncbi:ATP-binding protein [Oleiagrimonas sp. C23AA]|uniref:sensor histidine kinase n=1 Tax=Oleiagrimonas sp. C23AA TaxID=2719047 RepID=UPI00141F5B75|nr:ATP-binding protein [Oleiagrimonas sp. C23AA]NII10093.1 hypothetical protein [Oleiagrimonas sp. C23AA]
MTRLPSLTTRVAIMLSLASIMALGSASIFMDRRVDSEMQQRFDEAMLAQGRALASLVKVERGGLAMGTNDVSFSPTRLLSGEGPSYYLVRCGAGDQTHSSPAPPLVPAGWAKQANDLPAFGNLRLGNEHRLRSLSFAFQAPLGESWGRGHAQRLTALRAEHRATDPRQCQLLLMQDRRQLDQILESLDWILLLTPTFVMLLVLVMAPVLVRRGLAPLTDFAERMRGIGPASPGQRLATPAVAELEPLAERFNEVLARMDEGLARERQFAGGLAHETRTRLAELRALLEVEQRYPSGRPLADILGEVAVISAEMEATVTALLLLTRLESGIEQPQWQAVALPLRLTEQWRRVEPRLQQRHLVVDMHTEPVSLHTDPALLDIVLRNLVGNACDYAPTGSTVQVRLANDTLSVGNPAPDLEPADIEQMGQRFWRKRHASGGHAGLGLALAHAAAAALGLHLNFALDDNGQFRAELRWPPEAVSEAPTEKPSDQG